MLKTELEGYKTTRLDRLDKTGGRVCMYTRVSLKLKRLKDTSGISESGFHQLRMQMQLYGLSFVFCVLTGLIIVLMCFINVLMDNYSQALTLGKSTGDLHCDLLEPGCSKAVALLDFCKSGN